MDTVAPIRGSGQILKAFEREITYITTVNVEPDSDGYVRGDRKLEYSLKAAVVPVDEEEYDVYDYGEGIIGLRRIQIRKKEQEEKDIDIDVGDYFEIDDKEWKVLDIDDYGTVIMCTAGRSSHGGYPLGD